MVISILAGVMLAVSGALVDAEWIQAVMMRGGTIHVLTAFLGHDIRKIENKSQ